MNVILTPELEAALNESARQRGVAPHDLALETLRQRFLSTSTAPTPLDDWERALVGLARVCGVSLPASALTTEGLYE